MAITIRAKVDNELARRFGKWFTVREIQDKLRINHSTLKPLIMKYAREKVLRRRHVKGTARSVQFSPAGNNLNNFRSLLVKNMPYRNLQAASTKTKKSTSKRSSSKKSTARKTTKKWR